MTGQSGKSRSQARKIIREISGQTVRETTRDLVAQPAFGELRGAELTPGPDVQTDAEVAEAVRALATTDFHPCGTCRMGHGADAVVDSELRVHGMEALRVVDASVMPRVVSGNLNAPTQMVASRAADWILGTPQLEPFEARFAFRKADPE